MRVLSLALVTALLLSVSPAAQTLGETDFPNSGAPEAQEPFLRGLLLLHSFEYADARDAFQEAQRLDPDFAMAYWGEALTHNHPIWMEQDREAARRALRRLAPTADERLIKAETDRERDYLRTLEVLYGEGTKEDRDDRYAEAMADLAARYPGDLDAAAFYALSILGTAHEGRDFTTYMRAAAVAEEVFDRNPRHPGAAHYLIHSYDDPVHAPLGVRPARAYAEIAPDASHALHMPSHIWVALGRWDEAATMNRRAFEAAGAASTRRGEALNGHGWHALYWRHYAELQRGHFLEAGQLLEMAAERMASDPSERAARHYHSMLTHHLIETEDWEVAGDLDRALEEHDAQLSLSTRARLASAEVFRALREGAPAEIARIAEGLQDRFGRNEEPRVLVTLRQIEGLHALAQGDEAEAIRRLTDAANQEAALPLEFGPPFPAKPSHELLADVLTGLGRSAEALPYYEVALQRTPRRAAALLGFLRAAEAAGDDRATGLRAELQEVWRGADPEARALLRSAGG